MKMRLQEWREERGVKDEAVNLTVLCRENPEYQEGAIVAFTEAIENHWFDGYV